MGAWETDTIYAIDPSNWKVLEEVAAPGKPYGIAPFNGALSVVVSLGEDDDRYICRFLPGTGFDVENKIACPDFTGSHLASDGSKLYLGQQGKHRILVLDDNAGVSREIPMQTRFPGFAFDGSGASYAITADEEWENLAFARIDLRQNAPVPEPIAAVPFEARALAFDGAAWWTSDREIGEIVSFSA